MTAARLAVMPVEDLLRAYVSEGEESGEHESRESVIQSGVLLLLIDNLGRWRFGDVWTNALNAATKEESQ